MGTQLMFGRNRTLLSDDGVLSARKPEHRRENTRGIVIDCRIERPDELEVVAERSDLGTLH